jgi:hypothetical protein
MSENTSSDPKREKSLKCNKNPQLLCKHHRLNVLQMSHQGILKIKEFVAGLTGCSSPRTFFYAFTFANRRFLLSFYFVLNAQVNIL